MREAVLLAFLSISLLTPLTAMVAGADPACVIDPVPYERLLADTLESILSRDWGRVTYYLRIAESAQICDQEIASLHARLYESLSSLSNLLRQASAIEDMLASGETEGLRDRIGDTYNGLDYLRNAVHDEVVSYYVALSRYAQDRVTFFEYRERIERSLSFLIGTINTVMERLASIYVMLNNEGESAWVRIGVYPPPRIYAGDEAKIFVSTAPQESNTSEATVPNEVKLKVSLIIGNVVEVSEEVTAHLGDNVSVTVPVPDTEELMRAGVEFVKRVGSVYAASARIAVSAEAVEGSMRGFAIRSVYVYALKPPIVFYVPSYVEAGKALIIEAVSNAVTPVQTHVFLDRVSNETHLLTTVVMPGRNNISVPLSNASPGYHTLIILSNATGRYIRYRWSSAVVIGTSSVPVVLDVPKVVLVPPFIIEVGARFSAPGEYRVLVYVDGGLAYSADVSGGGFSALLELPLSASTIFVGRSVIRVEVVPSNPGYAPSVYVINVLVINVLSTLILIGVTGALYLHPRTAMALASLVRVASLKGGSGEVGKVSARVAARIFRPFRLRKLYLAVTELLSRIVPPPAPHETLREYLRRVEPHLPPWLVTPVRKLFTLFELDLYSVSEVSLDEARRLVRAVESGLSRGDEG